MSEDAPVPMPIWAVVVKSGGLARLMTTHIEAAEAERVAKGLRGQFLFRGDTSDVVVAPGEIRVPA